MKDLFTKTLQSGADGAGPHVFPHMINPLSSLVRVGLSSRGFQLVPQAEQDGLLTADTTNTHHDPDTGDVVECDCSGECRDWIEANDPAWALPVAS